MKKTLLISIILFIITLVMSDYYVLSVLPNYTSFLVIAAAAATFGLFGGLITVISVSAVVFTFRYMHGTFDIFDLVGTVSVGMLIALIMGLSVEQFKKKRDQFLFEANALKKEKGLLAESEEKYRLFLDNMADGFSYQKVIFDSEGTPIDYTFLEVNRAFERLTGLRREDILGKRVTEAIPGAADPFYDWVAYYEKAIRSGREVRFEKHYPSLARTYSISINSPSLGFFYTLFHDVTEIKESGNDYKKVVENTKDIITRFDKNLNCLYLNIDEDYRNKKPMEIIFGRLGINLRIPKEIQNKWENAVRHVFMTKHEETIEMKMNTPQGVKYYECRMIPEFSHEGYVDSVLCINRDDTPHRTTEEDMKHTLEKLKELENIINVSTIIAFLCVADECWSVDFISRNVEQFGYSQDEFIEGKLALINLIHKGDLDRVAEEKEIYINEGVNEFTQEFRIITKSGEERLAKIEVWARRNPQGNVTHFQGMITDVTSIIKMPQHLIDSERQYRDLFDSTTDIVFILDTKGNFLSINRDGEDRLGYTRDELKKMNFLQVLAKESREQGELILNEMVSGAYKEKSYNLDIIDNENRQHPMGLHCQMVLEGGQLSIAVTARDTSERYNMVEQVKYLSYHDKLTGLYNRTFFEEELARLEEQGNIPLSIIVGDVDGLKMTNDAFGHKQGDQLLIKIANILKASCSIENSVFRLGGDEFAIILPEADERETAKVVNRIKNLCNEAVEDPVKLSIALGASTMLNKELTIEALVKQAEDRMNRSKMMEGRSIRSSIIFSLQKTLEEKTFETKKHAERMQKMAAKIGKRLGLSGSEMDELSLLCALHDIGKIGIPDNILMKSGRLSADEWETMKKHTEIGYNISISSPDLKPIAEGILAHHENWDGTGYPKQLSGNEIPLISRIISVIDAYDAMTNDRPYHKAISQIAAIIEIDRCAGTQFDPKIVDALKKELLA